MDKGERGTESDPGTGHGGRLREPEVGRGRKEERGGQTVSG